MFSFTYGLSRLARWVEEKPLSRAGLFCTVLLLIVYAGMPADELTFDNSFIIGDDTRLQAFTMESLGMIFRFDYWWPTLSSNLFRPLSTLSFWFEYSFLGYAQIPLGYQLTNLALHLANSVLLFALARRLRITTVFAIGTAALYAVHPIATEVVANIVGRSDLLATLAMLSGLNLYFEAINTRESESARRNRLVAWSGVCALLGVMAKESAIVLPGIIAWHGILRIGELRHRATAAGWRRDAMLAGAAMVPAAVFFLVTRSIFAGQPGVNDHPFIDNPMMAEGFVASRLTAMGVWGMQLHALFLPFGLSSDYSFNTIPIARWELMNSTAWWGFGTMAVFAIGAVLVSRSASKFNHGIFLFGAYVIAMLPTANLLIRIGSIRADRFHYQPSALFWLGFAGLLAVFWERARRSSRSDYDRVLGIAGLGLSSWLVCLLLLAHFRCYDWRSNLTLWRSALQNAPGSVKAAAAVANETVRVKNDEESARAALARITDSLAIYRQLNVAEADWPLMLYGDYGAFSVNLYDALMKKSDGKAEAEQILRSGLRWMEEGLQREQATRQRWADRWAKGDLSKAPTFEMLHRNYVIGLMRSRRGNEALAHLDMILEKRPLSPEIRELKARYFVEFNRPQDAVHELMLVSILKPQSLNYMHQLGAALQQANPGSNPLIRDPDGNLRLDMSEPNVHAALAKACVAYRKLVLKNETLLQVVRLERTAQYIYGVDFSE